MEEKNIRNAGKNVKNNFRIALVLSLMLIVGVPMIVLGASNKIWAVMAIGIAFTVLGFYGCPLAWVMYGEARFRASRQRDRVRGYGYCGGSRRAVRQTEKQDRRGYPQADGKEISRGLRV